MIRFIIASTQDWYLNINKPSIYDSNQFITVKNEEEFNQLDLKRLAPEFIFFIHWNWIVPKEIVKAYECVVFHIAPLPYGRGGSPVQNLILKGYTEAPVNALKMTETLDGGPIYASKNISLNGTIVDIFSRAAVSVESLIEHIIKDTPKPSEQKGAPLYFKRLKKEDNELNSADNLPQTFNKIRMVDGLNYPRAFIKFGKHKIEFTKADIKDNSIVAEAKFDFNELPE